MLFLLCVLPFSSRVFAQMEIGQITGVVTEPTGAHVANAEMTLDNPLTGRRTQTVSDDQGRFCIQDVPYGTYVLHVSAKDFTPSSKQFRIRSNVMSRGERRESTAQDDFSLVRNLNLSLGVRYDHSDLLVSDHQVSPRIGGVYYLPKTKTAIRASFNKLYMPAQAENLLIASSAQARALSPFADSGGGADIRPEKLFAWEVGFAQELPKSLRLNVAYWWRHFTNIDDPNVLLGTTIIFPNSVEHAHAQGLDVRFDVPIRRGFSAYFTYTNNQVVEIGPINGGLFLDDDFITVGPGTRFTPDHDQRNVASFALTYAGRHGLWSTFAGRYESGVPLELPDLNDAELRALPGSNLVNFDTGRVKPWYVFGWSGGMDLIHTDHFTVGSQLDIQNVANRDFAFNWGNPFSGTHFGYPRLIAASLKISFKK